MGEFFVKLFDSDFMGHGYCYLWKPDIVRLHATSDGLIALSYYFIPLVLIYLVRRRRDLPFHWMFLMFGVFILGCGTTHLMEIWTLLHGTYRLAGVIKAITAAASVATAVALIPMVPRAMQLPSPFQLQAANLELEKEIARRKVVEEALETERNFVGAIFDPDGAEGHAAAQPVPVAGGKSRAGKRNCAAQSGGRGARNGAQFCRRDIKYGGYDYHCTRFKRKNCPMQLGMRAGLRAV